MLRTFPFIRFQICQQRGVEPCALQYYSTLHEDTSNNNTLFLGISVKALLVPGTAIRVTVNFVTINAKSVDNIGSSWKRWTIFSGECTLQIVALQEQRVYENIRNMESEGLVLRLQGCNNQKSVPENYTYQSIYLK